MVRISIWFLAFTLTVSSTGLRAKTCDLASIVGLGGNPSLEIVTRCLEQGGDVNARGRRDEPVLNLAVRFSDDVEVVRLLISSGADIRATFSNDYTVLHSATGGQANLEMLPLLIKLGADIEARDLSGYTPLHKVILPLNPSVEVVRVLLEAGADPNTRNNKTSTPLFSLIFVSGAMGITDSVPVIELLIEYGADINAFYDFPGETHSFTVLSAALHYAVNFEDEVEALIAAGADVNLPSRETGRTSLRVAVCCGYNHRNITALLDAGADASVKDYAGNTALDYALSYRSSFDPELLGRLRRATIMVDMDV